MSELNLRRFDDFAAADVRALPGKLRRAVIADRKHRVTALLQIEIAMRASAR